MGLGLDDTSCVCKSGRQWRRSKPSIRCEGDRGGGRRALSGLEYSPFLRPLRAPAGRSVLAVTWQRVLPVPPPQISRSLASAANSQGLCASHTAGTPSPPPRRSTVRWVPTGGTENLGPTKLTCLGHRTRVWTLRFQTGSEGSLSFHSGRRKRNVLLDLKED